MKSGVIFSVAFVLGLVSIAFFSSCCGRHHDCDHGSDVDVDIIIGDDTEVCVACDTTEQCVALIGPEWICRDNCCVGPGGGDDDSSGGDDTSADDTGDDTVVLELDWAELPGGAFEMGCSPGDPDCHPDEEPRHTVNISPFAMAQTEVTQAQFKAVTGREPSLFTPANGFDDCPDCPVENVNWADAGAFCERVGGRLPTEAEWEYAARAGATTRYYCGDDIGCLDDIAWHSGNSGDQTHPAATKEPNDFDLYDMLGNVWEWVRDWYDWQYYQFSPLNDPPGAETGSDRVLRGGAWKYDPDWTTTASDRYLHAPEHHYNYFGFRCAR